MTAPTVTGERQERASRVQVALGLLLRGGVLVSAALIVLGIGMGAGREPSRVVDHGALPALRDDAAGSSHDLPAVFDRVVRLDAGGLVTAGLLVLIVTPIARVALSLVLFAIERDRAFVVLTVVVLVMLSASFALGHAGG